MTAHITYRALDADAPATLSPTVIADVIRGEIGFNGVLISDDITMKALDGTLEDLARGALAAGCDVTLLCNADFGDRRTVLEAVEPMAEEVAGRIVTAFTPPLPESFEDQAGRDELDALLAGVEAA
jgi:beta-N-acetylhexosaminidase